MSEPKISTKITSILKKITKEGRVKTLSCSANTLVYLSLFLSLINDDGMRNPPQTVDDQTKQFPTQGCQQQEQIHAPLETTVNE